MKESEIIKGCKKLDQPSQRMLVRRYSGMLFTVCRRYCGDDFVAKEALQEGLIRIFKYIDSFQLEKGSFEGWMKRIVTNESLKIIQKQKSFLPVEGKVLQLSENAANALDQMHEEELIRIIQELPDGYREVFNMYVIDGYSHKEIGEILDITDSTSRSQLSRAKKLLQQKISMIENLQLCRKRM